MSQPKSVEPPWYGPVCPVVWEGWSREAPPIPIIDIAGEMVLTERALHDGTRLTARLPSVALLVENLGPYIDVRVPEDWIVPGWNTATARLVLDQLEDIPLLHFGDLDPQGAGIANHLKNTTRDCDGWCRSSGRNACPNRR